MKERHINRRIIVAIMFLVLSGIGIILYRNEKTWKPDGLKVELMENPVGIDTLSPAFSWKVNGKEEGVYQKAYQIVVAATRKKLSEGEYLIDSGWCESGENTYVKLENAEKILNNNQIYYWKVRIKDGKDNYSHFSEVNTFSTGVGAEWQETNGIWSADEATYIFLRNKFELKSSDIERAILSIIALSPEDTRQYVYSVYLNEKYVGSGPAQMAGNKYYYNSFDVTKEISRKNVLGAVCYSNKEQGFLCQLTVYYTNGAKETVVNSSRDIAQWKCMNGNAAYGLNENMTGTGYYLGNAENIDAEYYPMGWLKENYDTASWETPVYTWTLKEQELSPYQTENMQKYYSSPSEVKEIEKGHYFIDLGKEIIGGIAVKIPEHVKNSSKLILHYGEELNEDGSVRYQMRTGNVYEEIWNVKGNTEKWESFGIKAFRYIEIYSEDIQINKNIIQGVELRQPFQDSAAEFYSSDNLLNEIYQLTKNTVKATNQNLYVDSWSRERGAYEGDAWINMLAAYAFEDHYTLARVSNEYLYTKRTWPAEYPMYAVFCAWQDYMYTGNIDSLKENYDRLKENLSGIIIDDNVSLVKNNYGEDGYNRPLVDWPETERDGYAYNDAEYNTVVNAVACASLRKMGKIAGVLHKEAEEEYYSKISDAIKKAMIEQLYDEEKGCFSDGLNSKYEKIPHYAQHATAYALYAKIYNTDIMKDNMVAYLKSQGEIRMSVFGSYFLLQGLYDNDAGDYAMKLLTEANPEKEHTWAYMLNTDKATITTEAWSTKIKDNMTFSHPWGASPAAFIVQGMFGIEPKEAGFTEFDVKLQPGQVKEASVKVPVIKGDIEVSYLLDQNNLLEKIVIKIPSNTTANVKIPEAYIKGKELYMKKSRLEMQKINGYRTFKLEAGTYEIDTE